MCIELLALPDNVTLKKVEYHTIAIKPDYWSGLAVQVPGEMIAELCGTGNVQEITASATGASQFIAVNTFLLEQPTDQLPLLMARFPSGEPQTLLIPLIDPYKFRNYLLDNYNLLVAGQLSSLDLADSSNTDILRDHLYFMLNIQGIDRQRAGDLAHTMGNITGVLSRSIQWILEADGDKSANIGRLKSSIDRLSALLAKMEHVTDMHSFSGEELILYARNLYAGEEGHKLKLINTDRRDAIPHQFSISLSQVRSAFDEVIWDAEKYSQGTEMLIQWEMTETAAVVTFEDNGVGMNEERLRHLNAELQQDPDAIPDQGTKIGGTGLLRLRKAGLGVRLENRDAAAGKTGLRTVITIPLAQKEN